MYWLPLITFLAHVAEEYRYFPQWATRYFGATSRAWYVYSHIPLIGALAVICALADQAAPRTVWPMLAIGAQWVLATNAVFHLVTTALFRAYSPGVVTGTLLFLPATVAIFWSTIEGDMSTPSQIAFAVVAGSIAGVAVIASLWLPMDLDWRLRRPA
jgi:hypothetical protein